MTDADRIRRLHEATADCRRLELEAAHARIAWQVAAIRVRMLVEEAQRHGSELHQPEADDLPRDDHADHNAEGDAHR